MKIVFNGYVCDDEFIRKLDKNCEKVQAHGFKDYLHDARYGGISPIDRLREIRKESEKHKKIEDEKVLNFSQDEMLQIVKDFYKQLSPNLSKQVESILDKNNPNPNYKLEIIEDKNDPRFGRSRVEHSDRNPYLDVNISLDGTVEGLRVTAHELSHAMSLHQTKKIEVVKEQNEQKFIDFINSLGEYGRDCISEIESHIIEYLFMEYLVNKGIITNGDYENFEAIRHNSFLNNIDLIREEYEILKNVSCPITKESFEQFVKKIKTPLVKTDKYKSLMNRSIFMAERSPDNGKQDHYSQYRFRYVVGEIVSTLWYEQYLSSSKEQQKEMIKNFEIYLNQTDTANLQTACQDLVGMGIGDTFEDYICHIQGKMFER